MLSKDLWARHQIPIIATVAGLSVAAGLALAPVVWSDDANERVAAPSQTVGTAMRSAVDEEQMSALDGRVAALEAAANQRLAVIETRLDILDKAVVRGHARTRALQSQMEALATTPSDVSALMARVQTLDKAVVRGFERTRALQEQMTALETIPADVNALVAKVQTLDKAVPRLHQRAIAVQDLPAALSAVAARVKALEAQVMTLNKAVVRTAEKLRQSPADSTGLALQQNLDELRLTLEQISESLQRGTN